MQDLHLIFVQLLRPHHFHLHTQLDLFCNLPVDCQLSLEQLLLLLQPILTPSPRPQNRLQVLCVPLLRHNFSSFVLFLALARMLASLSDNCWSSALRWVISISATDAIFFAFSAIAFYASRSPYSSFMSSTGYPIGLVPSTFSLTSCSCCSKCCIIALYSCNYFSSFVARFFAFLFL